jgi:hypothetical protein
MLQIARFEVDAVKSCNLSCTACNHLSPLYTKGYVDPDELEEDLTLLARHLHCATVRVLGGEPLLHPEIVAVLDAVRRSELGNSISVVTNGVLLGRMPEEFWRKVDVVDVSIYPGVTVDEGVLRRHQSQVLLRRPAVFYETFSTIKNEDKALTKRIFEECSILDFCVGLSDRRFYRCMRSAFIPGKVVHPDLEPGIDGLPVVDSADFDRQLDLYLKGKDPLRSCAFCTGTSGAAFAHTQTQRVVWLGRQARPIGAMLDPKRLS